MPGTGNVPGPSCRAMTEACAETTDCCDGLICAGNACTLPPMCRSNTEACAETTDCCDGLICAGNQCQPPPVCAALTQACAATTDCCDGLVCLGNQCQLPPVCGDGTCSGGETAATCCNDCGCAGQTVCSNNQCVTPSATIRFTMRDSCDDGRGLGLRYFDPDNGIIWPADLTQVFTIPPGETRFVDLACVPGGRVCYGARTNPDSGVFWGVDIDGSKGCDNCCARCGQHAEFPGDLICR